MKKEQEKLPVNEEKKQYGEVTRRDFLVGAGTVVVGGAIGAGVLSGCGGEDVTKTVVQTTTKTVPTTVTTTVGGTGAVTVTETVSTGGATVTKTVTEPSGGEPAFEPETTILRAMRLGGGGGELTCSEIKNGKIIRIRPLHYDSKYTKEEIAPWSMEARGVTFEPLMKGLPSYFSISYKKRVYSPNRVMYPLQRIDWEPGGDPAKINPQNRGKSKFKRITWDEATTTIANEIKRVHDTYGPYAVLCIGEDGHHESKVVHVGQGTHMKLMSIAGGYTRECRNPDSWEGWWWGAKHVWGNGQNGQSLINGAEILDIANNTEMIVWQGSDWETTPQGFGGQFFPRLANWLRKLGIKNVYIAPDVNYQNAARGDKWIPVIPDRDDCLQLAIIYTWLTEDTWDKEYVDTHAVGMDKIQAYVMGDEDGIPKTPTWASPKCGVPTWTIKALAREWASKVTSTGHFEGGSFIRGPYSTEPARLECVLLGMQGLGKPGRFELHSSGVPSYAVTPSVRIAGTGDGFGNSPQMLPRTMIHHAILEHDMENTISWYSTTAFTAPLEDQFVKYTYPIPADEGGCEIHMMWSEKTCNTVCWNDGFKFIEACRSPKVECFVAQQQWLENDCLFADIVLPVSTLYEEDDIAANTGWKVEQNSINIHKKAIEPVGESMSDYLIACEIAKKLGVYDQFTGGKTVEEKIRLAFDTSGVQDLITWEEFNEKGYYIPKATENWKTEAIPMSEFYKDPVKSPLALPSGKLEFYSERLAEKFPDDNERGPMPKHVPGGPASEGWTHDESRDGERAKKYPLLIVSNHPRWRHHAQNDDNPWVREIPTCKVKGPDGYMYECTWIHPVDAAARGINHGDIIKVYNERGIVLGGAYVTERIVPGAVLQDHGAHVDLITDGIDRGGSNNLISPYAPLSKNCWGQSTSGFLVEVEKLSGNEYEQWRRDYPEAFARDYEPSCGLKASAYVEGGI